MHPLPMNIAQDSLLTCLCPRKERSSAIYEVLAIDDAQTKKAMAFRAFDQVR